MPKWWIAFPLDIIHIWFGAAVFTAFSCLALDQVPNYRATMMSMRSIFSSVGGAMGAALAGAMLIIFGSYQAVGISFGIMSMASAGAFFLTRDPTKRSSTNDNSTR